MKRLTRPALPAKWIITNQLANMSATDWITDLNVFTKPIRDCDTFARFKKITSSFSCFANSLQS